MYSEEEKQCDILKSENEKLRIALHNCINQACQGANYHNALFNIIETVANALGPDYAVYRQHGVLTPTSQKGIEERAEAAWQEYSKIHTSNDHQFTLIALKLLFTEAFLAGSATISDGWLPIETAPALLLENEKLKEEVKRLKEKYEPGECEKFCGMNYCDENGCTNRIRNYVDKEPIKTQS